MPVDRNREGHTNMIGALQARIHVRIPSNKCFSKQLISRIPQANTDKYLDEAKKNKRKKQIISPLFLIHNKSEYFTFLVWQKIKKQ
jgi:hypothetical protein